AFEQQRKPKARRQLEDGREKRVKARVQERYLEDGVVPDDRGPGKPEAQELLEVAQADELAGIADADAGEREPDSHHERIGNERAEQHDRRSEEGGGQEALVLEDALEPRRLSGAGARERHLDTGGAPGTSGDRIPQARKPPISLRRSSSARSRPASPCLPPSCPARRGRTCRR